LGNNSCPVCGSELKAEQKNFSVYNSCPKCCRYERIETDTLPSPERVISEQLAVQAEMIDIKTPLV